jgi:hypothetical protein
LIFIEEGALLEVRQRAQLRFVNSLLSADRRVDLDSEPAANEAGHVGVEKGDQRGRQRGAVIDAIPHGPKTPEDGRTAGQHHMVEERRAVPGLLSLVL